MYNIGQNVYFVNARPHWRYTNNALFFYRVHPDCAIREPGYESWNKNESIYSVAIDQRFDLCQTLHQWAASLSSE